MTATIRLVNTSVTSYSYFFWYVVRIFKIYSLSSFSSYGTTLFTVTIMLYVRSPELVNLITSH